MRFQFFSEGEEMIISGAYYTMVIPNSIKKLLQVVINRTSFDISFLFSSISTIVFGAAECTKSLTKKKKKKRLFWQDNMAKNAC